QNPRVWRWRQVDPGEVRDFIRARRRAGLGPLMVHLSYLPNLAATEPLLQQQSAARLAQELTLARALEADYLVVHPGHGELSDNNCRMPCSGMLAQVGRLFSS
ncbi:MAG: hypothetical protein ACLQNE_46610, partial [Thermoguttaceae bacterium]